MVHVGLRNAFLFLGFVPFVAFNYGGDFLVALRFDPLRESCLFFKPYYHAMIRGASSVVGMSC